VVAVRMSASSDYPIPAITFDQNTRKFVIKRLEHFSFYCIA
jgi:hypothetical protein